MLHPNGISGLGGKIHALEQILEAGVGAQAIEVRISL